MPHTKAATGPNKTIEPPADSTNTLQSDVMKQRVESIESGASNITSGASAGNGLVTSEIAAVATLSNTMNQGVTELQKQVSEQMQDAEASLSKLPPEEQAQARQELQNMEQMFDSALPTGGAHGGARGPGKG